MLIIEKYLVFQNYENKLFIVPSPYDAIAGMGLKYNLLPQTAYERGESRTHLGVLSLDGLLGERRILT